MRDVASAPTLWSGVRRTPSAVAARRASMRMAIGFDEGPVFPESYEYIEKRGVTFERNVLRDEARAVLQLYHDRGGKAYG